MKKQLFSTLSLAALAVAGGMILSSSSCGGEDTTPPVVTLTGDDHKDVVLNDSYTDEGATAEDDEDGTVTVTDDATDVNTDKTGTYTITYTATDAAGNAGTATRTVVVYNVAEDLEGNWDASDVCDGTGYTYTVDVTSSSTVNNKISIGGFWNGAFINPIEATVSGTAVTIASQEPDGDLFFVDGTGSITGSIMTLDYTVTETDITPSITTSCSVTYQQQ